MFLCAHLSSSTLQLFDGTHYRYRPENNIGAIHAPTIYQLGPEPQDPTQRYIWHVRRMALVATSLDGPASTWYNTLTEKDKRDWPTFHSIFLKQFDNITAQFKASS